MEENFHLNDESNKVEIDNNNNKNRVKIYSNDIQTLYQWLAVRYAYRSWTCVEVHLKFLCLIFLRRNCVKNTRKKEKKKIKTFNRDEKMNRGWMNKEKGKLRNNKRLCEYFVLSFRNRSFIYLGCPCFFEQKKKETFNLFLIFSNQNSNVFLITCTCSNKPAM